MTRQDFSEVAKIAKSDRDLSNVDIEALHGCATPGFQPVTVTKEAAARLLRELAQWLNGEWDSVELDNAAHLYRRVIRVV